MSRIISRVKTIDKKVDKNIKISDSFIRKVESNSSNSKVLKTAQKTIENSKVRYAF